MTSVRDEKIKERSHGQKKAKKTKKTGCSLYSSFSSLPTTSSERKEECTTRTHIDDALLQIIQRCDSWTFESSPSSAGPGRSRAAKKCNGIGQEQQKRRLFSSKSAPSMKDGVQWPEGKLNLNAQMSKGEDLPMDADKKATNANKLEEGKEVNDGSASDNGSRGSFAPSVASLTTKLGDGGDDDSNNQGLHGGDQEKFDIDTNIEGRKRASAFVEKKLDIMTLLTPDNVLRLREAFAEEDDELDLPQFVNAMHVVSEKNGE